jgi:preprotein translocase subunit SecA
MHVDVKVQEQVPGTPASDSPAAAEGVSDVSYSAPDDPSSARSSLAAAAAAAGTGAAPAAVEPAANTPVVKNEWVKTGRNEPCPCGSGKKFKQCHGR